MCSPCLSCCNVTPLATLLVSLKLFAAVTTLLPHLQTSGSLFGAMRCVYRCWVYTRFTVGTFRFELIGRDVHCLDFWSGIFFSFSLATERCCLARIDGYRVIHRRISIWDNSKDNLMYNTHTLCVTCGKEEECDNWCGICLTAISGDIIMHSMYFSSLDFKQIA